MHILTSAPDVTTFTLMTTRTASTAGPSQKTSDVAVYDIPAGGYVDRASASGRVPAYMTVSVGIDLYLRTTGGTWTEIIRTGSAFANVAPRAPGTAILPLVKYAMSVTRVGPETVAGLSTVHYRTVETLQQFRLALQEESAPGSGALGALAGAAGTVTTDLFLTATGLPISITDIERVTKNSQTVTETVSRSYSAYGLPSGLSAPAPRDVKRTVTVDSPTALSSAVTKALGQ